MIKESYTENFYSYNSKYINNALALRPPQHESLDFCQTLRHTQSGKESYDNGTDSFRTSGET